MENLNLYQLLHALGITSNYKGCQQTAIAVQLALQNENRLQYITREIYWEVARQMGCGRASVERNIRTVVQVAQKTNPALLQQLAGYPLPTTPTASEFISILTSYLLRHQPEPSAR